MSKMQLALARVCAFVGLFSTCITAAQLLPGDALPTAAAASQLKSQIARAGNQYLVVWEDTRSVIFPTFLGSGGPYTGPGLGTMTDIYAARLDSSGKLLDTIPILIAGAMYNQTNPVVGWNGQDWLVVWMTERASNRYYHDIMAVRVSPTGMVLDGAPLLLKTGPTTNDAYTPWAVSSEGTNWSVAYRSIDTTTNVASIDGLRIAPDGTILDPGGKRLREDNWNSGATDAELAFAGDEYLLTWTEIAANTGYWTVRGQLLSPSLDPIGSVFDVDQLGFTSAKSPRIASDGVNFLCVWFENRYTSATQVYGTRVSHTGQVLDPGGIAISPSGKYTQFAPAVAWDGSNYFVAYNFQASGFNEDIYVTRVSTTGTVRDSNGILIKGGSANQNQPSIAASGTGGVQITWTDLQAGGAVPQDIAASAVSSAGAVTPSSVVSRSAPRQRSPRLAGTGSEFLAVFVSEVSGQSRIMAQRLDTSGKALDPQPAVVASSASAQHPTVAWNGTVFLVIWEDSGQVYGRRIFLDGTFADASAVTIMRGSQPDVAALGDIFLVAANDAPIDPHYRFTFATRVNSAGVVIAPAVQISGSFTVNPAVTALGSRWVVLWEGHPSHDDPTSMIGGIFVNGDGSLGTGISVSSDKYAATPAVASSSSEALIVWADGDIFGRRILYDGTVLDPSSSTISGASGNQFSPAVAFDGANFVVDWLDERNDPYPNQERGDIYATRIDASGNVLDPSGFAVANSPAPEETPTVGSTSGETLFAYAAFEGGAPYTSFRIALAPLLSSGSAGCVYSLSPTGGSVTSAGGTGSFNVTTSSDCPWTATSNATWVTVTGVGATGSGTVNYSVAANSLNSSRSATISAGGQNFTVTQAGAPCSYSVSPTSASMPPGGGNGTVLVTTATGCAWTAKSNASWITIYSGWSTTGTGTVSYETPANWSTASRTGALTVAGQTVKVTQPAIYFAVSGKVVKANGKGFANVTLSFSLVSGTGSIPLPVQTDSNGNWNQTGFQSGATYLVTPHTPRYTFNPTSISVSGNSTAVNFIANR